MGMIPAAKRYGATRLPPVVAAHDKLVNPSSNFQVDKQDGNMCQCALSTDNNLSGTAEPGGLGGL